MQIFFQLLGKEFSYVPKQKEIIRALGKIYGIYYLILDLGSHPTAYIGVEKGHKNYGKKYDDIDLDVHGGLTFGGRYKTIDFKDPFYKTIYWYGWDYAHAGDYLGWDVITPSTRSRDKQWKYFEVLQHVMHAIKEFNDL